MRVHCGERGDKQPSRSSPSAGAEQPSAALRPVTGVLRGTQHRGGTKEVQQALGRTHRPPLSHRCLR